MFIKNQELEILIHDLGNDGEGIGKVEDFIFFVQGGIPGDLCLMKVLKVKKNYGYGKVIKIIEPSENRVSPLCEISEKCGGCSLMALDYNFQLKLKRKKIKDSLERIGGFKGIDVPPVIPMENLKSYRNKAQVPIRAVKGKTEIGFYAKKSHRIIPTKNCYIQQDIVKEVLDKVEDFMSTYKISAFDEESGKGTIRHILVKSGVKTEQTMVCIIVNLKSDESLKHQEKLIEKLIQNKKIKSIALNYNIRKDNVILGDSIKIIWGKDYIEDCIGDIQYKISPLSFFQINSLQAENMYNTVIEFADITEQDIVLDAYCGIGSISLFLARKAKHVTGIEIVPEAIEDAKENAKLNNISNVDFICGKSEEIIYDLMKKEREPDVIVVDPPRKGCDIELLKAVADIQPKKFIYVSCNPDTLARDLKILAESGYGIQNIRGFDMFGFGTHVETCVLLSHKNS